MDVSPVESNAKCANSDFSIERILSNASVKKEPSPEAPSWLCCTRYQPPKLPRSVGGSRARRSGRHARVPFTAAQAAALEAAYSRAPYLAPPALRALAAALQLRDDRIKIWFQNRRARERRERSSTITPPREVTLPPTTFDSQGLLAVGRPWTSQAYTVSNTSNQLNTSNRVISPNSSTSSDYKIRELPRDLQVPTTITESVFEERPDTPLDIETID